MVVLKLFGLDSPIGVSFSSPIISPPIANAVMTTTQAATNPDCFLCTPPTDLIYCQSEIGFALSGLGPLVPGYSVVATRAHVASVADAIVSSSSFIKLIEDIRAELSIQFGNCIVTEHGRLPVCDDVSGTTDSHCYHAHVLIFPNVAVSTESVRSYFASWEEASNIVDATTLARNHKEYFLFSPDPTHFVVFTRPGKLIRQFARWLVADALGDPSLANWRQKPSRESAVVSAKELRALFQSMSL